jgi:hypothetical protein
MAPVVALVIAASSACSNKPEPPKMATKESIPVPPAPPRITMFYANPQSPPSDEKTLLCYGVENADTVQITPAIDRLWPTPTRCIEAPARAVTYTLTASRGNEKVSQTVKVTPVAPKVKLIEVSINKVDIKAGEAITVCYSAKHAASVTIKPGVWVQPPRPDVGCVKDMPTRDTTYIVTATGKGGETDSERVTARVSPAQIKP